MAFMTLGKVVHVRYIAIKIKNLFSDHDVWLGKVSTFLRPMTHDGGYVQPHANYFPVRFWYLKLGLSKNRYDLEKSHYNWEYWSWDHTHL
uniref:Uncharacterized protein n=1 Tax=Arion vulgaris TaxID=1028688 RepID=A0A0B6ZT38_9EUPU